MKVLHVVPTLTKKADGVSVFVKNLANNTFNKVSDLRIATLENEFEVNNYPILNFKRDTLFFRLGISLKLKKWCKLNNGNFNIVHNHGLWMMPNIYVALLLKNKSTKLIISPHGALSDWAFKRNNFVKKIFWLLFQKKVLQKASVFHATSIQEYNDIRRHGFIQPICIIPIGIDLSDFPEKKIVESKEFLYLARIHPVKGIDTLLHAWKILENDNKYWSLRIVGPDTDSYSKKMKKLAINLNLKRVYFNGPLYDTYKVSAYQNAEVYILPTRSENFGLTVLESLASNTPVIVTKAAPWYDIEESSAGWWIEEGITPLVNALKKIMTLDTFELYKMGSNGRLLAEQKFSWEIISNDFVKVYNWLINNDIRPSSIRTSTKYEK